MGLAISDEEHKFSFEFGIWPANKDFFSKLKELLDEKEIGTIVVGYPLNLSGQETKKTEEVVKFKEKLEIEFPQVEIEFIDERLSSKMAAGIAGRDKNIDSLAAQIFLEAYLNKKQNN